MRKAEEKNGEEKYFMPFTFHLRSLKPIDSGEIGNYGQLGYVVYRVIGNNKTIKSYRGVGQINFTMHPMGMLRKNFIAINCYRP